MSNRVILAGLAGVGACIIASSVAAQSTRTRPVVTQPPAADLAAPLPPVNRLPDAPVRGPNAVPQIQQGAMTKRVYPAYKCRVGVQRGDEKAKNPNATPTFYDVEFLPDGDGVYRSTGEVLAFNQFSYRMVENAGVIEFKIEESRADYVKSQGEILASWVYPVKWTLANGQIAGTYTQYWFVSAVSGRCQVR